MRCAKCGADNREGRKFCAKCAAPLARLCPQCGASNEPGEDFCGDCGGALSTNGVDIHSPRARSRTLATQVATGALDESAPSKGERRHLTVLFCDMVNSTEIAARLDPEEWRDIVARYQQVAAEAVVRFDGHVAQYLGDGVLAVFGYPTAHENDAERAVRTGLEIIEKVSALDTGLDAKGLPALAARVGIHAGQVVVGDSDNKSANVFGDTPNMAARVQAAAERNTVIVSAAVYQLVSGRFVVEDRGAVTLKGIAHPVQLYRVIQPSVVRRRSLGADARALTPFVGREDETRLLLSRWERARYGQGQVVLAVGEPGIGKSRLVEEFRARIKDDPHLWIDGSGEQLFESTPFHAVTEMLDHSLGWRGHDSGEERISQLERTLELAEMKLGEAVPLIAEMMNLPIPAKYPPLMLAPDPKRKRLLANLVMWVLNVARLHPVIVALENLHWVDPSTLEFQQTLIEQNAAAPLLLLYTARPEFRAPWPMRAHHVQIALGRLGDQPTREMVASMAAQASLDKDVIDEVVKRTSGVPLFVEELTRAVLESGTSGGREIPVTLRDSLMSRLDRLGPAKEVIQVGAVIGSEFSYELLRAVHPLAERDLQKALCSLTEAELLYERVTASEATYLFKHALIRDAAYDALLKSERRRYHHKIAEILRERFSEIVQNHPELLASHYTAADLVEQAIPFWRQAGQRAIERSAYAEAISHLTKGLELIKSLPDAVESARDELELQTLLGLSLASRQGYAVPEVEQTYRRARELCQRVGSTTDLFPVVRGLCTFYIVRDDQTVARELAEQCLRLAQDSHNVAYLIEGHTALGYPLCYLGELQASRTQLEQCLTLYESHRESPLVFLTPQDPGVACLTLLALVLWLRGYPNQALQRSQDALTLAQQLERPFNVAYAHAYHAMCHQLRREAGEAAAHAQTALQISTEYGFEVWRAAGALNLGVAQGALGQPLQGITLLIPTLAAWRAVGTEVMRPYFLSGLAEAYCAADQFDAALAAIAQALEHGEQHSEHFYDADLYRLRGEITLAQTGSTQDSAEADFLRAIEIARKQQAKSLELRATTSLHRLRCKQGRGDESRAALAEIYNWFTEGFDTADLKEAKALLEDLNK